MAVRLRCAVVMVISFMKERRASHRLAPMHSKKHLVPLTAESILSRTKNDEEVTI
jgi:hypothetical protein